MPEKDPTPASTYGSAGLQLDFEPWGPDQATLERLSSEVVQHPALVEHLEGARSRLLSLEAIEDEANDKQGPPQPPSCFRATLYDYTNGHTVHAVGWLDDPADLIISDSSEQPLPSREEFE